ncbi:MAG: 4-hydroxy-tetrahydrodipicolinate synthase [Bdellovibrionales bacterium]|nr:4-hydroxy-tetrahydrodipicolinate synthase [Bdellovibrionales bacterium]
MSTTSLKQPADWAGVWTALITPLRHGPKLDHRSLEALINAQIQQGARGLVIAGSTGEGSLLGTALYTELLQTAQKIAAGRIPLVAGLGIGGTDACLQNLEIAQRHGYNGVLASPPAYIKTPQRGLVTHFLRIAEGGIPLCLYEVAGRAASSLEVNTIVEIVDGAQGKVPALKDASGDVNRTRALHSRLGGRLAQLTGDDPTYSSFLQAGGVGVISVVSHVALPAMVKILELVHANKFALADAEQARLLPLIEALFWESNPIPTKSLLAAQGKIAEATFCAPLCGMKPDLLEKLQKLAKESA